MALSTKRALKVAQFPEPPAIHFKPKQKTTKTIAQQKIEKKTNRKRTLAEPWVMSPPPPTMWRTHPTELVPQTGGCGNFTLEQQLAQSWHAKGARNAPPKNTIVDHASQLEWSQGGACGRKGCCERVLPWCFRLGLPNEMEVAEKRLAALPTGRCKSLEF